MLKRSLLGTIKNGSVTLDGVDYFPVFKFITDYIHSSVFYEHIFLCDELPYTEVFYTQRSIVYPPLTIPASYTASPTETHKQSIRRIKYYIAPFEEQPIKPKEIYDGYWTEDKTLFVAWMTKDYYLSMISPLV